VDDPLPSPNKPRYSVPLCRVRIHLILEVGQLGVVSGSGIAPLIGAITPNRAEFAAQKQHDNEALDFLPPWAPLGWSVASHEPAFQPGSRQRLSRGRLSHTTGFLLHVRHGLGNQQHGPSVSKFCRTSELKGAL
jgi:hypothetical protein